MLLTLWFLAFYFVGQDKQGISAVTLMSMLETAYKTTWYMLVRICTAMGQRDKTHQLNGTIEFDDTYFGGPIVWKSEAVVRKRQRFLWSHSWMNWGIPAMPKCRLHKTSGKCLPKSLLRPHSLKAVRSTAIVAGAISYPWRTTPMSIRPTILTRVCSIGCTS